METTTEGETGRKCNYGNCRNGFLSSTIFRKLGMILINYFLNGKNFLTRKCSMIIAFKAKPKSDYEKLKENDSINLLTGKQCMVAAHVAESRFGFINVSGIKPENYTNGCIGFERIVSMVFAWIKSPYVGKEIDDKSVEESIIGFDDDAGLQPENFTEELQFGSKIDIEQENVIFVGVESPNYENLAQENDGYLHIQPMEVEIEDIKLKNAAKRAGDEDQIIDEEYTGNSHNCMAFEIFEYGFKSNQNALCDEDDATENELPNGLGMMYGIESDNAIVIFSCKMKCHLEVTYTENVVAVESGKEVSSSRAKMASQKRLPINGNGHPHGSVAQKSVIRKDEKSVKCNVSFDGDSKWEGIQKKDNFDVVSFTFTSPIKRSVGSNSCNKILEATSSSSLNFDPCACESELRSCASSSGFNAIGGDALSVLLEQKLNELTSRVGFSPNDMSESGSLSSSINNCRNMGAAVDLVKSQTLDNDICRSKQEIQNVSHCALVEKVMLRPENESKGLEYFEGDGDDTNITYQSYLHFQESVSVSSQPSLSGASSDSFDVYRSSILDGRLACLSPECYGGINSSSTRKAHVAVGDVEISDTASSLSVRTISETVSSSPFATDSKDRFLICFLICPTGVCEDDACQVRSLCISFKTSYLRRGC